MNHEALIHEALQDGEHNDIKRLVDMVGCDRFAEALRTCAHDSIEVRIWAELLGVGYEEVKGIREGSWWEITKRRLEGARRVRERINQLERQRATEPRRTDHPRLPVMLEPNEAGWTARNDQHNLSAVGDTPEEALAQFWREARGMSDSIPREKSRVWQCCLDLLERQLPRKSMEDFLYKSVLIDLGTDTATVRVQSEFARDRLESRYGRLLHQALRDVIGRNMELRFVL